MTRKDISITPDPLPETSETLHLRREPRLNDRVKQLLTNGAYAVVKPFIGSVNRATSFHGSVEMDRAEAAASLQNFAKQSGDAFVSKHSRADIGKALETALKSILDENDRPIDRKSRKLAALAKLQTNEQQPADNES